MSYTLLSGDAVITLHDQALNAGELPGLALDKSLESALARVDNRLAYGMIEDVFDLAAADAEAIATGHCFNDGNKRTAFDAMIFCLDLNDVEISWHTQEVGDLIIRVAQRQVDGQELAAWLRGHRS